MGDVAARKKGRGTAKVLITHIVIRVSVLEKEAPTPTVLSTAKQLLQRLNHVSDEFTSFHRAVIDVIDDYRLL